MKFTVAGLSLVLCMAAFVVADDKKDKFDAEKLVGDWTLVEGVKVGEKVDKDRLKATKVKTTKDSFILEGEMGKFVMGYKLDTTANPVGIDLEIKEGPIPEGKAKGIIWVKGDDMKLCYIPNADGTRPAKFESTKENGALFWTLKRNAK